MGAWGALDSAAEFGGTGREYEQGESTLLAGLFEQSRELAAANVREGPDRKGSPGQQSIQKECGGTTTNSVRTVRRTTRRCGSLRDR